MRIFITVTEEPVFINPFLKKVIQARHSEICGIAIVSGSILNPKKGKSRIKYLLTIALITDPIQFIKKAAIVITFNLFQLIKRTGITNPLSIAKVACEFNILVTHIANPNSAEFIEFLRQNEPDVIINQAQAILKSDFISVPKIGCLNRHGALLPKYRGRLAPFWAYVNNEKETGVSIHFIDEKIDNGPILVQKKVKIGRFDTLDTLLEKVFSITPQAMLEALELIESGQYKDRLITNDSKYACYYSSPGISDGFKYRSIMLRRMWHGE